MPKWHPPTRQPPRLLVIHVRAERKSDSTIDTYFKGVRPYLAWCQNAGVEPLDRSVLKVWPTELLDAGLTASTARTRMMPVRYFGKWLADEGIEANPFVDMKPPQIDESSSPSSTMSSRAR